MDYQRIFELTQKLSEYQTDFRLKEKSVQLSVCFEVNMIHIVFYSAEFDPKLDFPKIKAEKSYCFAYPAAEYNLSGIYVEMQTENLERIVDQFESGLEGEALLKSIGAYTSSLRSSARQPKEV